MDDRIDAMTHVHLLSSARRALLLGALISLCGCAPQVIYVPYPASQASGPVQAAPADAAPAPEAFKDEPVVLARFQHIPEKEAAPLLRQFGHDPETSMLWVHQLSSNRPDDFGPIAVMSFTNAGTEWTQVLEYMRDYGDDAVATMLTSYMSDKLSSKYGDAYLGVSDVSLLKEIRSVAYYADYVGDDGTLYHEVFWRTWENSRTNAVVDTQFLIAGNRQSLYTDDMVEFIKAVLRAIEKTN